MVRWNSVNFLLPCLAVVGLAMFSGCAEKTEPATSGTDSSPADAMTDLGEPADLGESSETTDESEVAELSAEDKALVEAQMFCPIGDKLGGMGTPIKVMHEGKPVFLCCEHCREPFLKDPEKGLAAIEEKKQKAAAGETEKEAEPAEEAATEKEAS